MQINSIKSGLSTSPILSMQILSKHNTISGLQSTETINKLNNNNSLHSNHHINNNTSRNNIIHQTINGSDETRKKLNKIFTRLETNLEIKRNEERFNLVYRKQAYFCNRCGTRVENMYEGKLIRFTEDHTCNPKDILKLKVQIMNGERFGNNKKGSWY